MSAHASSPIDIPSSTKPHTETTMPSTLTVDTAGAQDHLKKPGPKMKLWKVTPTTAFTTRPAVGEDGRKRAELSGIMGDLDINKMKKAEDVETALADILKKRRARSRNLPQGVFQFTFRKFPPEIRDLIFEYAYHNRKIARSKESALLKALKPHPNRVRDGDRMLYPQAISVFNKTHDFKLCALRSSSIREMDEQKLGAIRYMTIEIPHTNKPNVFSERFCLAANVRHLTLTARFKQGSNSLQSGIEKILPGFQQLRTLDVEVSFFGIIFTDRDEEESRNDSVLFVSLLDAMLGASGEWRQKGDNVDNWQWKAEKGKTLTVTEITTKQV